MWRSIGPVVWMIGMWAMVSGCQSDPTRCETDLSCFAQEKCVQKVCVLESTQEDQGVVPIAEMGMDMGADISGEVGCKLDSQCEEGLRCDLMLGKCVTPTSGPSCDLEMPCKVPGQICEGGECKEGGCSSSEQCGFGRFCDADGLCGEAEWDFMFFDGETGEVPAALQMEVVAQEDGRLSYRSQSLVALSNTTARIKAELELFAGSNELELYFETCQFAFVLRREAGDVLMDSKEGAVLVDVNRVVWRGEQSVIKPLEDRFTLDMDVQCDQLEPGMVPPFEQLGDESVISLDFSRLSGDVGRGYPVRIKF